ncbi:unnamed protein product [Acanthoscelides obtectus]|nr:unnamed protein product [Acanthoscelides obtectus]CAK1632714.1 hypothetical protein AOBTE_LOCUS7692 [Acanthoscelides obtectus]
MPSTILDADPESLFSMEYFGAEGISFKPLEPMKKWHVSYKGKMKQESNPQNILDVELEGIWYSDYPWILFEVDSPAHVLATSFALEEWSKKYFQKLKETHQSHYEQMGFFSGKLKVNGKYYELDNLDAFRDHSFGHKRDWTIMHRYIYHMFYLKDGTKISVGVISQPCTSSNLMVGYVAHPNKKVDMIDDCDLKLYQHGENGTLPTELCFTVTANHKTYELQVKYLLESIHYKGRAREAKMHERFHKCIVNGVSGRGISEWHYNNKQ